MHESPIVETGLAAGTGIRTGWLLAAIVLACPSMASAAGNIFEAEIVAAGYVERTGSMAEVSDTDACGNLALEALSSPNSVAYTISFMEDGDRYVWLRLLQPTNSQRSVLVTLDGTTPPTFADPSERFDVSRGGASGYVWQRVTLRGTGTTDTPEEDPRIFAITTGNHTLAFSLPDADVRIDRFAITTALNYVPNACDDYVDPPSPSDGGPNDGGGDVGRPGGDGGPFVGAIASGCEPDKYWDLVSGACLTPQEPGGCAQARPSMLLWVGLAMIALRRKRSAGSGPRDRRDR